MYKRSSASSQHSLMRLFWPICLEIFCMMLAGVVDTLMLSSVGDLAVGAVGTANTYLNLLIVMFNIASTGMVAVMAQYIGAGQPGVASQTRRIGLLFNGILGVILSAFMLLCSGPFLSIMGTAPNIAGATDLYLRIVGGGSILCALIPIFTGHLRAFGQTRHPFVAAIIGNAVNIALNAYFLYVRGWGVAGVASATVISRCVNLLLVVVWSSQLQAARQTDSAVPGRTLVRQILGIGVPSACENIVYAISVSIIVSLINQLDPSGFHISARAYALQISSFSHCASSAFGQANAIIAGWYVGAGDFAACTRSTRRASLYSSAIAVLLGACIATLSSHFMSLFTADTALIRVITLLLWINVPLEIGRSINLCYGSALKAVGDAQFPVMIGVMFMLLCATGGTWFLGSALGMMPSVACFIGMCLDENVRGVLMLLRWRTGIWQKKSLVTAKPA